MQPGTSEAKAKIQATHRYLSSHKKTDAVLEFQTEIEGISVNGVDMISWNDQGQISSFKVMVRPLKAINKIHAMMGEMLKTVGNG